MQTLELMAHPAHPPVALRSVSASFLEWHPGWLRLRWRLTGSARVAWPAFSRPERRDELWRTTCFELFVSRGDGGYGEFNFSPSRAWAAYDFDTPREGMADRAMPRAPIVTARRGGNSAIVDVAIPRAAIGGLAGPCGIAAVIAETDGGKSYWALAHGDPARPDFHDPACFTAPLRPPSMT